MTEAPRQTLEPAVAIVGGGPAGLTAAQALAGRLSGEVLVLDREAEAGGIPRHSDHTGYGLRDQHRIMSGPDYAKRLSALARRAGANIMTQAMVTGWSDPAGSPAPTLEVTSPHGLLLVRAGAVVLATGARERPRTARRIPGDRPRGVLTTGQLQNLVHLHHQAVGQRAVVVGSELVSWSAVMTLREAGCRTVLMTTDKTHHEAYLAFSLAGRIGLRVKAATSTRVVRIVGRGRVESVEVEDVRTGRRSFVDCDTVVFTGDWIPDHELARTGGLLMDAGTRGPTIDSSLRTSRPGVFAAGNLIHPVDTADVAALDGRQVARSVWDFLRAQRPDPHTEVLNGAPIRAGWPFSWVAPNVLTLGRPAPSRERLLLWPQQFVRSPVVEVTQGDRPISRRRLPWPAAPGRVFRVPWSLLSPADPEGGEIRVGLTRR
ncbi:FAD-dependent oxidoreductase [Intrasporangium mesophilum]